MDLPSFLAFFAARFSFKDMADFFLGSLLLLRSFVMMALRIRDGWYWCLHTGLVFYSMQMYMYSLIYVCHLILRWGGSSKMCNQTNVRSGSTSACRHFIRNDCYQYLGNWQGCLRLTVELSDRILSFTTKTVIESCDNWLLAIAALYLPDVP